ncbi:unnamed protein product [Bursaphelenchus xylophilus]|uniref:(pine wood nematode) hypothetical protein n=1 Tax=Bursaphelenchus xylophilus TaxID=6326 RepID=A0A1I7RUQ6_BURXY|nr:unnamed protein product [Bursaphelenchus xylophilus]CAG9114325.1 unnamed protein product [Bursaphelenchus xylophilus]
MMGCLLVAILCNFLAVHAYREVQGKIYNNEVANFSGYPKIKVVLVDVGLLYDTTCGETIAAVDGYFRIECEPTGFRFNDNQKLKIYHRFSLGRCHVNSYRGTAISGKVEDGNYDAVTGDEPASDDSVCPTDLYD